MEFTLGMQVMSYNNVSDFENDNDDKYLCVVYLWLLFCELQNNYLLLFCELRWLIRHFVFLSWVPQTLVMPLAKMGISALYFCIITHDLLKEKWYWVYR